jgi:hypothetical protein
MMIQPSIDRTAIAPVFVVIDAFLALFCVGEAGASTSISTSAILRESRGVAPEMEDQNKLAVDDRAMEDGDGEVVPVL